MRLNLAHITLSMGTGGLEQCICHLSRHLDRQRFKLILGCLDETGNLLDRVEDAAVFEEKRKPGLDLALIFRLVRRFRRERVDIVHAHNQAAHFYAGLAARLARVPVLVCTEHSRHQIHGVRRRIIEKKVLYRITDKWITVSRDLFDASRDLDGLNPRGLALVPNGIPVSSPVKDQPARQALRRELGLSKEAPLVVMVARLDPVKNHGLMLRAMAHLKMRMPELALVLAGDGPERGRLEALCRELGIESKVRFMGVRNDVNRILAACDGFALCSRSEGLPLSLLEAAAARVPVVITGPANKAGFIRDGMTGRVVRADAGEMAMAVEEMVSSPASAKMAEAARKKVVAGYSVEAMTAAYERIYLELAGEKGILL